MNDPIELTADEQKAAAEYLENNLAHVTGSTGGWMLDVAHIIAAINNVRAGDPVGTTRRCSNGNIAVRCEAAEGVPFWRVTRPNGDTHSYYDTAAITDCWPVIYTPEAS